MRDLFQADTNRAEHFSLSAADLFLDYSKNRITAKTLELLCQLADATNLSEKINAMFDGAIVNDSEHRPALHSALRNLNNDAIVVNGENVMPSINQTLDAMAKLVTQIHTDDWRGFSNKTITDVVNLGIGGSDLGPAMATEALAPYAVSNLRLHFVSNLDGSHIAQTLNKLNPETTLFIVSSKSFTTIDTIANAETAKSWFKQNTNNASLDKHFLAITCNQNKAVEFGINAENIFPIWEWIGGRYSLWSAIGLPIALVIGMDHFRELLAGAHAMDQHFRSAPFAQNMPVILGLLDIWYGNFFAAQAHAILPYDQSLNLLPAYLQQASMESNGKQVTQQGEPVDYTTGPVIFGTPGTNAQHTFFQLLHQGTYLVPVDFIVPATSHYPIGQHHATLFANCLSQSKALMQGKTAEQVLEELQLAGYTKEAAQKLLPHKVTPGNRPSNTIIFPKLTPQTLGALLALYEHKIFAQCAIWQINPFDQWSVELGKQLAATILPELNNEKNSSQQDSSTKNLITYYKSRYTLSFP